MIDHAEGQARAVIERLANPDNPVGVEVGVYRGEMSAHLLRMCPRLTLHMVDNWIGANDQPAPYRATRDPRARASLAAQMAAKSQAEKAVGFAGPRAVIHHAASLDAVKAFADVSLDFVFIDADHSYEGVSADIEAWRHKVKPGGLLSGHDYVYPGERSPRGWPEVVRAVDEAVKRHTWTMNKGEESTWHIRL